MRIILHLVRKEFLQIFRNKGMLPIIFIVPIIQLIILSNAADFEIKNLRLYLVDKDQTSFSRQLISKLQGSSRFQISGYGFASEQASLALRDGVADLVLEIPRGFETSLMGENGDKVQVIINAIDGTKAGLALNYISEIIKDFNRDIPAQHLPKSTATVIPRNQIKIYYSHWFNPALDYKTFMVPGILVLLVTMIGAFLSSMNIVREKEIGTIEQINVTPIKKYQFVIGKLFPFWVLGLIELSIGFVIALVLFKVPFLGSVWLIYGFAAVYLLLILGMGLLISTMTNTQQQAMFISWFFLVIFILMGGLFTAIENMPLWAQKITLLNPVRYFIEVVRMVMLKGSSLGDVKWHFIGVLVYALALNGLAIFRYRKTA